MGRVSLGVDSCPTLAWCHDTWQDGGMTTTPPTIWLYGSDEPHPYHDSTCQCPRHCGNCFADLDRGGKSARARYCSDFCKGVAKRDRAFDRMMSGA